MESENEWNRIKYKGWKSGGNRGEGRNDDLRSN